MELKTLALLATVLLAANMTLNNEKYDSFEAFKANHGKSYSTNEEHVYRQAIFKTNEAQINAHNSNTQTHTEEVNHFSYLTQEEFKSIYLGYKSKGLKALKSEIEVPVVGDINWVEQGAVQVVKDQGQCGSCWAFSAVASAESLKFLTTGTLGAFSEQQLTSCDTYDGGCNGGFMNTAFQWFMENGICTEESYPYVSGNGSEPACEQDSCTMDSFTLGGFTPITGTSALATACNTQPISVAVDASNWSFYSSGVFSNCSDGLNHGVLLAGYTSSYWLIKNSWGSSWGESGYIRLATGNTCGLADEPSYPTA